MIVQFKQREERMTAEIKEKQTEIEALKSENQALIKGSIKPETGGAVPSQKYTFFLEKRISECLEENKRYLSKYSDLRSFSYQQIEWLIRKNQGK